jgi:hypothetical protein
MFANECFLQDLPALAAKLSKGGKFVSHKPACTRKQRTAGHLLSFQHLQKLLFRKQTWLLSLHVHYFGCVQQL